MIGDIIKIPEFGVCIVVDETTSDEIISKDEFVLQQTVFTTSGNFRKWTHYLSCNKSIIKRRQCKCAPRWYNVIYYNE